MSSSDEPSKSSAPQVADAKESPTLVVGLGVSAGGLEALEDFFSNLPLNSGMAFVVVQHLSPDFRSMLGELLRRKTQLRIETVADGMPLKRNTIYLMPAGKEMIVSDERLLLTDRDRYESLSLPIDHFFRSLAHDVGARAVAVVLSGSGSDGSRGIIDVHVEGGLAVAQSSESAAFDGMPNSAQNTGVVDFVGTPQAIAEMLVEYVRDPHSPSDIESNGTRANGDIPPNVLKQVFDLLLERHNVDFFCYKPSTIHRRISSHAQQHFGGNLEDYVANLLQDEEAVGRLYKDLLIGVTEFFRDPGSFDTLAAESLEKVISELEEDQPFRVWVSGCATGEEAYSLAILIDETARKIGRDIDIKVFGTDLHKPSIEIANAGVYPKEAVASLSKERIERYFRQVNGHYQIAPHIRRMLVFAQHDVIKDPPFTRMNLVSCRNLLIYFKPSTQRKVLSLFHFGLVVGGTLFLGSSESLGALQGEFETVNSLDKIYEKRSQRLLSKQWRPNSIRPRATELISQNPVRELNYDLEDVLNHCMPPCVLVDHEGQVIRVFSGGGKFLSVPDGTVSNSILDMVSGDLHVAISVGLQRGPEAEQPVEFLDVALDSSENPKIATIRVTPIRRGSQQKFAIEFIETATKLADEQDPESPRQADGRNPSERQSALQQELEDTKRSLRVAVENNRANNEALQSANEELMAANEELQGANEELQSVNEELYTVNAEYQDKISELTVLSNDMENLLLSTDVHTLFLDRDFRIRKFTPKIAEVFHLVPEDVHRPIQGFAHKINCTELDVKIRGVAESAVAYQQEVQDQSGQTFLMRILPYQVAQDTLGVVLTLTNISSLVESQHQALEAAQRFERAVTASSDGIWDWPDVKQEQMWWSPECFRMLGLEPNETPSTLSEWLALVHPIDRRLMRDSTLPTAKQCFVELHRDFEYRMRHKSGEYRWFRHRTLVDLDEFGVPQRMTGSVSDIDARKRAELRAQLEIEQRDRFLAILSHELRNPMAAVLSSLEVQESNVSRQNLDHKADANEAGTAISADDHVSADEANAILKRQIKHMARLLDDLLDVARIQQDRIDFQMTQVDLVQLTQEVLLSVCHLIENKNQNLHSSIPSGPLWVFGDPDRLVQAQVNLLTNASKFTEPYGDISYEIGLHNNSASITVKDNGIGISEADLESVFELFAQADENGSQAKSEGMGIGLSLAKSIVEAHNGNISASSKGIGQGSEFTIKLPIRKAVAARDGANQREQTLDTSVLNLLLVEDNIDVLRLMTSILRKEGFNVLAAPTAQQALEQVEQFRPHLAIVDIGLPGMNGYELAEELRKREHTPSMLLVALTGYGQRQDNELVKQAGFDHHLIKPVDTALLLQIVEDHFADVHESPT